MLFLFIVISLLGVCSTILGASGNLFDNRKSFLKKPKPRGWLFIGVNLFWLIGTIWFGYQNSEDQINAITGKEGYCRVSLSYNGIDAFNTNWEKMGLDVTNETDYNLNHVRVIWIEDKAVYQFGEDWKEINVGFVRSHGSTRANEFEMLLNPAKVLRLKFVIYSEGRETGQYVIRKFVNNKWVTAQSIYVYGKDVIYEVDKDYPERDPKIIFGPKTN